MTAPGPPRWARCDPSGAPSTRWYPVRRVCRGHAAQRPSIHGRVKDQERSPLCLGLREPCSSAFVLGSEGCLGCVETRIYQPLSRDAYSSKLVLTPPTQDLGSPTQNPAIETKVSQDPKTHWGACGMKRVTPAQRSLPIVCRAWRFCSGQYPSPPDLAKPMTLCRK